MVISQGPREKMKKVILLQSGRLILLKIIGMKKQKMNI